MGGGGFAKYTSSQPSQGSGFLSGQSSQTGSFLSGPPKTGSFLQGTSGQTGSFLSGGQSGSFLSASGGRTFGQTTGDQVSAKFGSPSTGAFAARSPLTAKGGFLEEKPTSPAASPFGVPSPFESSTKGSLNQRTQSLEASQNSRTQSYDMLEDESGSETETETYESESDGDDNVQVDALNFGSSGFSLSLDGGKTTSEDMTPQIATPRKEAQQGSPSVSKEQVPTSPESPSNDFVKVSVPSSTPSPEDPRQAESPERTLQEEGTRSTSTPIPLEPQSQSQTYSSLVPPYQPIPLAKTFTEPPRPALANDSTPPKPGLSQPRPIMPKSPILPVTPQKTAVVSEPTTRSVSPSRNKVELRQFTPVGGPARIAPKLTDSAVCVSHLGSDVRTYLKRSILLLNRLPPNS